MSTCQARKNRLEDSYSVSPQKHVANAGITSGNTNAVANGRESRFRWRFAADDLTPAPLRPLQPNTLRPIVLEPRVGANPVSKPVSRSGPALWSVTTDRADERDARTQIDGDIAQLIDLYEKTLSDSLDDTDRAKDSSRGSNRKQVRFERPQPTWSSSTREALSSSSGQKMALKASPQISQYRTGAVDSSTSSPPPAPSRRRLVTETAMETSRFSPAGPFSSPSPLSPFSYRDVIRKADEILQQRRRERATRLLRRDDEQPVQAMRLPVVQPRAVQPIAGGPVQNPTYEDVYSYDLSFLDEFSPPKVPPPPLPPPPNVSAAIRTREDSTSPLPCGHPITPTVPTPIYPQTRSPTRSPQLKMLNDRTWVPVGSKTSSISISLQNAQASTLDQRAESSCVNTSNRVSALPQSPDRPVTVTKWNQRSGDRDAPANITVYRGCSTAQRRFVPTSSNVQHTRNDYMLMAEAQQVFDDFSRRPQGSRVQPRQTPVVPLSPLPPPLPPPRHPSSPYKPPPQHVLNQSVYDVCTQHSQCRKVPYRTVATCSDVSVQTEPASETLEKLVQTIQHSLQQQQQLTSGIERSAQCEPFPDFDIRPRTVSASCSPVEWEEIMKCNKSTETEQQCFRQLGVLRDCGVNTLLEDLEQWLREQCAEVLYESRCNNERYSITSTIHSTENEQSDSDMQSPRALELDEHTERLLQSALQIRPSHSVASDQSHGTSGQSPSDGASGTSYYTLTGSSSSLERDLTVITQLSAGGAPAGAPIASVSGNAKGGGLLLVRNSSAGASSGTPVSCCNTSDGDTSSYTLCPVVELDSNQEGSIDEIFSIFQSRNSSVIGVADTSQQRGALQQPLLPPSSCPPTLIGTSDSADGYAGGTTSTMVPHKTSNDSLDVQVSETTPNSATEITSMKGSSSLDTSSPLEAVAIDLTSASASTSPADVPGSDADVATSLESTSNSTSQRMNASVSDDVVAASLSEVNASLVQACQTYAAYLDNPDAVEQAHMENCVHIIRETWFEAAALRMSKVSRVQACIDCFAGMGEQLFRRVLNMYDVNGNTVLHYAVSHGNTHIARVLLDTGLCDVNNINKAGYSPVMLAALLASDEILDNEGLEQLIKAGDVNLKCYKTGQTALMLSCGHGQLDTVKLLLINGSDINIQDHDGSTALMYQARRLQKNRTKLKIKEPLPQRWTWCATEHGHISIVRELLQHPDCDSTIVDHEHSSALTIAMEKGHKEIAVLVYAHQQELHSQREHRASKKLQTRQHSSNSYSSQTRSVTSAATLEQQSEPTKSTSTAANDTLSNSDKPAVFKRKTITFKGKRRSDGSTTVGPADSGALSASSESDSVVSENSSFEPDSTSLLASPHTPRHQLGPVSATAYEIDSTESRSQDGSEGVAELTIGSNEALQSRTGGKSKSVKSGGGLTSKIPVISPLLKRANVAIKKLTSPPTSASVSSQESIATTKTDPQELTAPVAVIQEELTSASRVTETADETASDSPLTSRLRFKPKPKFGLSKTPSPERAVKPEHTRTSTFSGAYSHNSLQMKRSFHKPKLSSQQPQRTQTNGGTSAASAAPNSSPLALRNVYRSSQSPRVRRQTTSLTPTPKT